MVSTGNHQSLPLGRRPVVEVASNDPDRLGARRFSAAHQGAEVDSVRKVERSDGKGLRPRRRRLSKGQTEWTHVGEVAVGVFGGRASMASSARCARLRIA